MKLRGWDLTPAKIESGTGIYLALSLAPESRIPGSERIQAHRLLLFGGICPMWSFPVHGRSATAAIGTTAVNTQNPEPSVPQRNASTCSNPLSLHCQTPHQVSGFDEALVLLLRGRKNLA